MWNDNNQDPEQSSSGEKNNRGSSKPAEKYNDEDFFTHYSNPQNTSNVNNTGSQVTGHPNTSNAYNSSNQTHQNSTAWHQ